MKRPDFLAEVEFTPRKIIIGILIILGLIGNILNLQSFISPYLNGAFQGVIIILAVLLQRGRRSA